MKTALIYLLHCLNRIIPKRDAVVLKGLPDYEDQCLGVLLELSRMGYGGRITWIMDSPLNSAKIAARYGIENLNLEVLPTSSLRAIFRFLTAKYAFYTHRLYLYRFATSADGNRQTQSFRYQLSSRNRVINLWHGMPIKRIWSHQKERFEKAPPAHYLPATSPFFRDVMVEASEMQPDQVLISGLPRNELLFRQSEESRKRITELTAGETFILYLPTFRKTAWGLEDGEQFSSVLNMGVGDAEKLNDSLKELGRKLVVKAHPLAVASTDGLVSLSHIVIIGEDWLRDNLITLYELAGSSAGLITDISSVYIDYLLLNQPIFIYFPDYEAYRGSRGFVFESLEEHLPDEVCEDVSQLIARIELFTKGNDLSQERRRRLREKFHGGSPSNPAKHLLDVVGIC